MPTKKKHIGMEMINDPVPASREPPLKADTRFPTVTMMARAAQKSAGNQGPIFSRMATFFVEARLWGGESRSSVGQAVPNAHAGSSWWGVRHSLTYETRLHRGVKCGLNVLTSKAKAEIDWVFPVLSMYLFKVAPDYNFFVGLNLCDQRPASLAPTLTFEN